MQFNIRTANHTDLKSVSKLVNSAYRGDYAKQGWTTEADLITGQRTDEKTLESELSEPGSSMELMFNEESALIGCVFLKEIDTSLYFGMLTVEPSLQGIGLGKILLNHIESIAIGKKKKTIQMSVIENRKELIDFYERRGFKSTGKLEPFPEGNPEFGIPKQKHQFLIFEKKLISESV